jgi:predicted enzyme related to lactoylglutathione lyase
VTRLGRAVLRVDDLDAALAFYLGLGFSRLVDETRAGGLRLVHVGSDGVAGAGIWLLPGDPPRNGPQAVLYVDDLDDALAQVAAHGGRLHREPGTDGGSRFAHVLDPAGNELVLVELVTLL